MSQKQLLGVILGLTVLSWLVGGLTKVVGGLGHWVFLLLVILGFGAVLANTGPDTASD